jgi:hypothetical protein
LQIEGRSQYLAWDEAARVGAGELLARSVIEGNVFGTWHWLHAQAFYPALMASLHGVALLVGADPVAVHFGSTCCPSNPMCSSR